MRNGTKRFAKLGIAFSLIIGLLGAGSALASATENKVAVQKVSAGEKALSKSFDAFAKVKSFAFEATVTNTTNGEKVQTKMVGENILKPTLAFKMTMSMNMAGQKMETSIIQTDNKLYMKLPGASEWTESELSESLADNAQANQMFDKTLLKIYDKITMKKAGNDQEITMTVNLKKYAQLFKDSMDDMKIKKLTIKYTIDGKTSLPKKMAMSMESVNQGSKVKTDLVYTYKSFNAVKPIKAPTVAQ